MGNDSKKGGGADDLLSKLFELDEGAPSEAPKADPFSQPTRSGDQEDHTDMGRSGFDAPSDQTEYASQSLDDLLGDVGSGTEVQKKPEAPEKSKAPPSGVDLFDGILNEEPLADEKINFFSPEAMKTETKVPEHKAPAQEISGVSERTEFLPQGSSPAANPFEEREKTMMLEEAVDLASEADPIDVALKGAGFDTPSRTAQAPMRAEEVVDVSDILADQKSEKPITEDDLMSELDGPSAVEEKKELSSTDFSDVFASGPIQVPEAPSKRKAALNPKTLRRMAIAAGILVALGGLGAAGWKLSTEDGFLGFRLDGFSLAKAYRPPTDEQRQEFAKVFTESSEARLSDDLKKIEGLVPRLEGILQTDARNLTALSVLAEHSAILMNWYGVGSSWTQKFEDYRQKFESIKSKAKETKSFDHMDRALALKSMALNNFAEAYSGLQDSLKNVSTADDSTLLLLAELTLRLHRSDEAKKFLERVTNKTSVRSRFLLAMADSDTSALKTLANEGYLPAKIEAFTRQPFAQDNLKNLLSESDSLLESVKTAPYLAAPIHRYRGDLYAALDNSEKARAEWKGVVDQSPRDLDTWMKIAESFESDAEWEKAIDAYRSAEKAGSTEPRMIVRLARLLSQRSRVSEAVKILEQAITAQPKSVLLQYEKGRVQQALYQDEPAKKSFKAALAIEADHEDSILGLADIALRQKEVGEAEAYFKKINEKSPHYAQSLRGLATVAVMKRQPAQQKQFLIQALKVNPKYEEVYPELVQIYLSNEEDETAETLVRGGLKLLPRSPLLKVSLARILQFQGRPDDGLKELEGISKSYDHILSLQFALIDLNIDKKDFESAWRLMNALAVKEIREPELEYLKTKAYFNDPSSGKAIGSNEAAVRILDSALTRDPSNLRYHLLSAQFNLKLLDKTMTLEHIDAALKLDSHYAPIYLVKGDLHMESGEFEKAATAYQEALKYTRFRSPIYHRLAEAFKRMGKASLAIQYYKRVTAERSQDAEPFLELGKLYNEEGRFSAAMESFKTAIKLNPKLAEAYYFLGFIQKDVGDRAGAVSSFEKFLALEPNSTESATIRDEVYYLKNDAPQQKN